MFSLTHKHALITGAGSGIGKAIAELFAKQGAVVHLLDLNETAVVQTATGINLNGGEAFSYTCNVSDQAEVAAVMNAIGAFSILVNCAGIAHVGKADTTSEADFDKIYQVNVKGTCLLYTSPSPRD